MVLGLYAKSANDVYILWIDEILFSTSAPQRTLYAGKIQFHPDVSSCETGKYLTPFKLTYKTIT
jgi:hypothetical protein